MELCMFSKRLKGLSLEELGRTLKELGFDGVDLPVRAGGRVEPEAVRDKLPEVKEILGSQGINISMITTAIREIGEPCARDVLETAGSLGIGYFKLRPYSYEGFGTLKQSMAEAQAKIKGLEPVCRESGIRLGFQTHSQSYLGASIPHILRMIEGCDPEWVGVYYDIGHAVVEGGHAAWRMNLDDVSERLFMVAAKDMKLVRREAADVKYSAWRGEVVPFGEGFVDWKGFIDCLKQIGFDGPCSLHSEYEVSTKEVIEQTRKDMAFLRELLEE